VHDTSERKVVPDKIHDTHDKVGFRAKVPFHTPGVVEVQRIVTDPVTRAPVGAATSASVGAATGTATGASVGAATGAWIGDATGALVEQQPAFPSEPRQGHL
jgi:outer membrane lipoprotein SlyB